MNFSSIGKIRNHASVENMDILPLWIQSISSIELTDSSNIMFSEQYSHYIIIHNSLHMNFSQSREELNRRFCANIGASVVSYVCKKENTFYVRGLIAENNSDVFDILPYTSFDCIKDAKFPKNNMDSRKRQAFNDILPLLKGKYVLDVGCGVGTLTIKIADTKKDAIVHGIDLLNSTIEQCKLNAQIEAVENTKFIAGSVYELPFENKYFDEITCFFMLHHLENIPGALLNFKRVLKDDGRIFAAEPIDHFHNIQRDSKDWEKLFQNAGYHVKVYENNQISYIEASLK